MSFPTDSVTDRMEEARGGIVVEGEGMVGGAVVVVAAVAAVVVTEGAVTQAAVVKANPNN